MQIFSNDLKLTVLSKGRIIHEDNFSKTFGKTILFVKTAMYNSLLNRQ